MDPETARDLATNPSQPPLEDPVADVQELIRIPVGGVTLNAMERALFEETHRIAAGNRSLMARMLGISRATVIRKLDRYGLD